MGNNPTNKEVSTMLANAGVYDDASYLEFLKSASQSTDVTLLQDVVKIAIFMTTVKQT